MKYQFLELLVGGFSHLEKYEFVNGWWIIPYIMENKSAPNHQSEYQYELTWPILDTPCKKKKNLAGEQVIPLTPKDYRIKIAI